MSDLPAALFEKKTAYKQENPIWPLSTLSLHRNLDCFAFPPKLEKAEMQQVWQLIERALSSAGSLPNPLFLAAEGLSLQNKEYLYEHFLCCHSFQNMLEGQGFFLENSLEILGIINLEDHLELHLVDPSANYQTAWSLLAKVEEEIGQHLCYAYSERFGYLSSRPELSGTGLKVNAFLHLPALIHTQQLPEALHKLRVEGVVATGLLGGKEEYIGDYLLLSNQYCLGVDEEKILSSVYAAAIQLVEAEKKARIPMKESNDAATKDLVARAYGLLANSIQLQTKEALSALSLIKLGIDLGWVAGLSESKIDELSSQIRRGHLCHLYDLSDAPPEELAKKRAEYLHKELQPASLIGFSG